MFHLLWLSDQILSGLIVGFFSLTATTINLVISGRRAPRAGVSEKAEVKGSGKAGAKSRGKAGGKAAGKTGEVGSATARESDRARAKKGPIVRKERARMRTVVLLGGWAVAAAFLVGDLRERWGGLNPLGVATAAMERMGAFQVPWAREAEAASDWRVLRDAGGSSVPAHAGTESGGAMGVRPDGGRGVADRSRGADGSGPVPGDTTAAPVSAAAAAGARSAWLEADGLTILYRYASYLPGACPGEPGARGSWNGGWSTAAPARCVDGAWLAFDLAPLLAAGRISFNVTYCINFQDQQGTWGSHGGAEPAPGWAQIAVPSEAGVPGTLGFRVVRGEAEPRVAFTAEFPRAPC